MHNTCSSGWPVWVKVQIVIEVLEGWFKVPTLTYFWWGWVLVWLCLIEGHCHSFNCMVLNMKPDARIVGYTTSTIAQPPAGIIIVSLCGGYGSIFPVDVGEGVMPEVVGEGYMYSLPTAHCGATQE